MIVQIELAQSGDALGAHASSRSAHSPGERVKPSIFQYDYLVLNALSADVSKSQFRESPVKRNRSATR